MDSQIKELIEKTEKCIDSTSLIIDVHSDVKKALKSLRKKLRHINIMPFDDVLKLGKDLNRIYLKLQWTQKEDTA